MPQIESFVFFDIETTGLPWQEKNRTKITELSLVAALRKDLFKTKSGESPPVSKLTLVFNPAKPIHPKVVSMNGLSNKLLQHAPLFRQKTETIISFLHELPEPVCLVAHNGNVFDFKILLTEFNDAKCFLPENLLCVDSLVGFRKLLSAMKNTTESNLVQIHTKDGEANGEDLITDDEDDWPDLNVSTQEWKDIDNICESLSDISCDDLTDTNEVLNEKIKGKKVSRSKVINKVFNKGNKQVCRNGFSLLALFRRLMNKEPANHHRAEEDCLMLIQCVSAVVNDFIPWADSACVELSTIKPLIRQ